MRISHTTSPGVSRYTKSESEELLFIASFLAEDLSSFCCLLALAFALGSVEACEIESEVRSENDSKKEETYLCLEELHDLVPRAPRLGVRQVLALPLQDVLRRGAMVPHDLHHLRELELVGGVGRDSIDLQRAKESEGQNREGEERMRRRLTFAISISLPTSSWYAKSTMVAPLQK